MLHLFLNPSPLLVAGEVLVGMSLPMFVAALVATFGDRIRQNVGADGCLRTRAVGAGADQTVDGCAFPLAFHLIALNEAAKRRRLCPRIRRRHPSRSSITSCRDSICNILPVNSRRGRFGPATRARGRSAIPDETATFNNFYSVALEDGPTTRPSRKCSPPTRATQRAKSISIIDVDRVRLGAVGERHQKSGTGATLDQSLSTYRLPSACVAHDGQRLARSPRFDSRVHRSARVVTNKAPSQFWPPCRTAALAFTRPCCGALRTASTKFSRRRTSSIARRSRS
jgi:hypothetical protein